MNDFCNNGISTQHLMPEHDSIIIHVVSVSFIYGKARGLLHSEIINHYHISFSIIYNNKPGAFMCVQRYPFCLRFYGFSIRLFNCSKRVIFFVLHFISYMSTKYTVLMLHVCFWANNWNIEKKQLRRGTLMRYTGLIPLFSQFLSPLYYKTSIDLCTLHLPSDFVFYDRLKTWVFYVCIKTRDFQEPVIACPVFNLTFKVNRNERATNNFESWPIKNHFSSNFQVEDFDVIFFS